MASSVRTVFRACNLCEAICGLKIEVDGPKILSIRDDDDDPFSRGHICPKAVSYNDLTDATNVDAVSGNAAMNGIVVEVVTIH